MIKKIALAAALAVSASFATWDKFPVLENHNGQAKAGFGFGIPEDKTTTGDLYAGVRYTVITGLELGTVFDYRLFTHYDGKDAKADGVANLPILVRYQILPIVSAFLDVTLPIGDDSFNGDATQFHFGAQYSSTFGIVSLGTELGLQLETKGDDKTTPPWILNVGAEGDFVLGPVTAYVGADVLVELGKNTYDGDNVGDSHTGDLAIFPYVGANYALNQALSFDVAAIFGFGNKDLVENDADISFDVHANFNF